MTIKKSAGRTYHISRVGCERPRCGKSAWPAGFSVSLLELARSLGRVCKSCEQMWEKAIGHHVEVASTIGAPEHHTVYKYITSKRDVRITEHEDGVDKGGWSYPIEKANLARVFWEALKTETERRGDLSATFIDFDVVFTPSRENTL